MLQPRTARIAVCAAYAGACLLPTRLCLPLGRIIASNQSGFTTSFLIVSIWRSSSKTTAVSYFRTVCLERVLARRCVFATRCSRCCTKSFTVNLYTPAGCSAWVQRHLGVNKFQRFFFLGMYSLVCMPMIGINSSRHTHRRVTCS